MWGVECAFYGSVQRKIEIMWRVTFDIHANAQAGLFVECLIRKSEFNQNWWRHSGSPCSLRGPSIQNFDFHESYMNIIPLNDISMPYVYLQPPVIPKWRTRKLLRWEHIKVLKLCMITGLGENVRTFVTLIFLWKVKNLIQCEHFFFYCFCGDL